MGADRMRRHLDRHTDTSDPEACWNWGGRLDRDGYGRCGQWLAHRLVYIELQGPIPSGLQLDHLCRNRQCVNPKHLEPVTPRENTLRGLGLSGIRAHQTHCKRGHEFNKSNTYRPPGNLNQRICRTCAKLRHAQAWNDVTKETP